MEAKHITQHVKVLPEQNLNARLWLLLRPAVRHQATAQSVAQRLGQRRRPPAHPQGEAAEVACVRCVTGGVRRVRRVTANLAVDLSVKNCQFSVCYTR